MAAILSDARYQDRSLAHGSGTNRPLFNFLANLHVFVIPPPSRSTARHSSTMLRGNIYVRTSLRSVIFPDRCSAAVLGVIPIGGAGDPFLPRRQFNQVIMRTKS